jgi:hypothetical protein
MTTEQAEVAGKFVDKLIDLGIALCPDTPVRGNRPSFLAACVEHTRLSIHERIYGHSR